MTNELGIIADTQILAEDEMKANDSLGGYEVQSTFGKYKPVKLISLMRHWLLGSLHSQACCGLTSGIA